jgi:hypothetical protein
MLCKASPVRTVKRDCLMGRGSMHPAGSRSQPILFASSNYPATSVSLIDLATPTTVDIVTDWAFVGWVSAPVDGSLLVFEGARNDTVDRALYAVRTDGNDTPTELDVGGAWFHDISIRGNEVYYTAQVGDDYEVRRVDLTSGDDPEVLYQGARLFATAWEQPVEYLIWAASENG